MILDLLDCLGWSEFDSLDFPGLLEYFPKHLVQYSQDTNSTAPVIVTVLPSPRYAEKDSLGL
jgi:hypothetical protein